MTSTEEYLLSRIDTLEKENQKLMDENMQLKLIEQDLRSCMKKNEQGDMSDLEFELWKRGDLIVWPGKTIYNL